MVAKQLATYLAAELEGLDYASYNWVVPVPSERRRMQERGFNPAGQIARHLAHRWSQSFIPQLLSRQSGARAQTGCSRSTRLRQVKGQFKINTALRRRLLSEGNPHPSVVLVDDVLTTGATLNECARILHLAGIQKIVALSVALSEV